MLSLNAINKSFITDLGTTKVVFRGLNLKVDKGDFISVIGSNGAGKSTLLDTIMGNVIVDSGTIDIDGKEIGNIPKHKRGSFISKVYQNPSMGTAPSMTVFENLSMADNKGKRFGLSWGLNRNKKEYYKKMLQELDLGIENQLDTEVRSLSGGQRQCLALLMATLNKPKILLLDEHTAALDPKTSKIIMDKTKEIVEKNNISTLMITHNLQDAIKYGNRLIMLHNGEIILDIKGEDKQKLTPEKLLNIFNNRDAYMKDSELFSA
ncbi:ABC transporter ATP-binding protein [Fusobacterium hominis]|uniref:ATP-binding cassette domain-containing protein n=1 Tax=Fusobacterium hominis TaxID=2764326 RepID=A0A7G9GZ87_9FUSO|nr:ATP-binding cassette domain-containing protein [Fusobacterium hominis]QNM16119.1 ATP-binding cassette domain-containing protein [Fusobacterium hominis]